MNRPTSTAQDAPCPIAHLGNLPLPHPDKEIIVLGIEGSANKVAVGVLRYSPLPTPNYTTLSNPRKTYISPPGHGFLPRETAWHHQEHIIPLIRAALNEAGITDAASSLSAITFTSGPGMGGPLRSCAIAARTLSLMFNLPLIPVNHCVAHIEMGRVACKSSNPVVLYVSGGNTQVISYGERTYHIFGETIDIGEFVGDTRARGDADSGITMN
jgi:N6-L-threonylcarbamoyladenine synthase